MYNIYSVYDFLVCRPMFYRHHSTRICRDHITWPIWTIPYSRVDQWCLLWQWRTINIQSTLVVSNSLDSKLRV